MYTSRSASPFVSSNKNPPPVSLYRVPPILIVDFSIVTTSLQELQNIFTKTKGYYCNSRFRVRVGD